MPAANAGFCRKNPIGICVYLRDLRATIFRCKTFFLLTGFQKLLIPRYSRAVHIPRIAADADDEFAGFPHIF